MAYELITAKGTTELLIEVMMRSSSTGQPLTGLAYGDMTVEYQRAGAAAAVTLATPTELTLGTWTTNAWKETAIAGLYQYGVPNACLADGATGVDIVFTATGAVGVKYSIMLSPIMDIASASIASATNICNMALSRLGANRLTDADTDTSVEAIQCRIWYSHTRDALLRSHFWKFAVKRAELSEDAETPDFGFDHQFDLPADFLRAWYVYDTTATWEINAQWLLTDDDAVDLVYVAQITDPTQFDTLFVELLSLKLALVLCMPLTHDGKLRQEIEGECARLEARARTVNMHELRKIGQEDFDTWIDARTKGVVEDTAEVTTS